VSVGSRSAVFHLPRLLPGADRQQAGGGKRPRAASSVGRGRNKSSAPAATMPASSSPSPCHTTRVGKQHSVQASTHLDGLVGTPSRGCCPLPQRRHRDLPRNDQADGHGHADGGDGGRGRRGQQHQGGGHPAVAVGKRGRRWERGRQGLAEKRRGFKRAGWIRRSCLPYDPRNSWLLLLPHVPTTCHETALPGVCQPTQPPPFPPT